MIRAMDYIEFKFWKLLGFVALALLWGIYCGATGRQLGRERRDKER
jgi:hypothetical protein